MGTGAARLHYHVEVDMIDSGEIDGTDYYPEVFDTQSGAWRFASELANEVMSDKTYEMAEEFASSFGFELDDPGNVYRSDALAEGEPEAGIPFGTIEIRSDSTQRSVLFKVIPCDGEVAPIDEDDLMSLFLSSLSAESYRPVTP